MKRFATVALVLGLTATVAAETVTYSRSESFAETPTNRTRNVQKTLVFAEREPYYPFYNFLHRWTDRPLFTDTSLWSSSLVERVGYRRDVEIAHHVGLDGFGALDYFNVHRWQLTELTENPPPTGFTQMFVVPAYYEKSQYETMKQMILDVAQCPYTTRRDGKLLFWAYGGGTSGQMMWANLLRADPEIPPFLFIGEMPYYSIHTAYGQYESGKNPQPIPQEICDAYEKEVEEAAAAFDGFQVWCTDYVTDYKGEYQRHSSPTPIYRKYVLPTCLKVMARPENAGKLIGGWLRQGYVNHMTGVTDGEWGTQTLRNMLNELTLANADIFMGFEWNEANENTHFQPTVAHGKTWMRIITYYRSLLDGTTPQPMTGDDTSVPNVIVTVRQAIRLGEPWHCELLYVPDGATIESVRVRATLKDETGAVIQVFPWETFDTSVLKAIDYRIPSEQLASHEALVVSLETEYGEAVETWEGFDFTRLDATVSKDYLYSHHPLREFLRPTTATLTVTPTSDGHMNLAAQFAADEEISSLEVVEGLNEVAAADVENDPYFDRANNVLFRGIFTSLVPTNFGAGAEAVLYGKTEITGAPGGLLRSGHYAWEGFGATTRSGTTWNTSCHFGGGRSQFFVAVPRDQVATAGMKFMYPKMTTNEISLAEVAVSGMKAYAFNKTARLEVECVEDLLEVPYPLRTNEVTLSDCVLPAARFPVYQLRAIAKSGKVWRSAPILPKTRFTEQVPLTVFSDTDGTGVVCSVAFDRVNDFVYEFSDVKGFMLPCLSSRLWDAQLGGADVYCRGMHNMYAYGGLPDDFVRPEPQFVTTNGYRALLFDGHGSYLRLPTETIPRGAVYTLDLEFRPDEVARVSLLRMSDYSNEFALTLTISNGLLVAAHHGVSMWGEQGWSTGLDVVPNEWNRLRVVKDFNAITCTLNGRSHRRAYTRRAQKFGDVIIGGNVSDGTGVPPEVRPLKGLVRALRVRHDYPDPGKTFTWRGGQSVCRFDEPKNWCLGELEEPLKGSNPLGLLPGREDSIFYNIGSVYKKFYFDLGGTTRVVRDFSGQTTTWYSHDFSVTNGTLEFSGSFSNRYIVGILYPTGGLRLGSESCSRMGASAGRCSLDVRENARLELGGEVRVNNLVITNRPGGTLFCDAQIGFDPEAESGADSQKNQCICNLGTATFPNGFDFGGAGSKTTKVEKMAKFKLVQEAGSLTLGGPIAWSGTRGEFSFEWTGGTIHATENVCFSNLTSCTVVSGATVTVEVAADRLVDFTGVTFEEGVTLVKQGAGRIQFGSSVPAVLDIQGGDYEIGADSTVPTKLILQEAGRLAIAAGTKASLTRESLVFADATTALPILEIATNATLTVDAGFVFKNVDLRVYGTLSAPPPVKFGWAANGETTRFALTADGGTFNFSDAGYCDFLCPESGGRVETPRKLLFRQVTFTPLYNTNFKIQVGYGNPTEVPFDVEIDGCFLDIRGNSILNFGGAAHIRCVNGGGLRKPESFVSPGLYGLPVFRDQVSVNLADESEFLYFYNRYPMQFDPADDGHELFRVADGSAIRVHHTTGNRRGVMVFADGFWDAIEKPHPDPNYSAETQTEKWITPAFTGLKAVSVEEGKFLGLRSWQRFGTATSPYAWNRVMKLADNVPIIGAGSLIVTNATPGFSMTAIVTSGANEATGEARAVPSDDGTTLLFADGANWAGTLVADENVAFTNLTTAAEPATVTVGTLQFEGAFPLRVWKSQAKADQVVITNAVIKVAGGFAPVDREGATWTRGDAFVIGSCPAAAVAGMKMRDWTVGPWKIAASDSATPGLKTLKLVYSPSPQGFKAIVK